MSYEIDKKTGEIVISGFETGIAPSPHKGIANIKNANISTETGEVMASYGRIQQTMTSTSSTGSLTFLDSSHVNMSITSSTNHFKGTWVTVSSSSHAGELPNASYFVNLSAGASGFTLSTTYGGSALTGYTTGLTATISLLRTMSKPIAYTTETYFISGFIFYRYYVLDAAGLVWVYDTQFTDDTNDTSYWFLPDTDISYWGSDTAPTGLMVLNGFLIVMSGNKFWVKPTVKLGTSYVQMTNALMMSMTNTQNPHFGFVGHQGRGYYTDGQFLGSIFPDTSTETGVANIQSYASWSASSTTVATISNLFSGSIPSTGVAPSGTGFSGIPAVFFTSVGGALPGSMTANVVYYIAYTPGTGNFSVYDTLAHANAGGATGRLDPQTGASGTQYFNTFYPIGTHAGAGGDHTLMTFTSQRLVLPIFEVSQSVAEIGNTVIIGTYSSALYPWNQVDPLPAGIINLPEANAKWLITVNQMCYIFAGYKGNVYITDGSTASLVIKVPDYCAGIAGTQVSYIEPIFTWGGAAYVRGRVYFSILDQTISSTSPATKAGNCGGIWSFVPTQNLYIGQDTGIALRLENRNSYATYNGYATLIIPLFQQNLNYGPQFYSAWQSSLSSATYGIDKTALNAVGPVVVETDLIPVGTLLSKYTPKQIEYKLAAPLIGPNESVTMAWRKNATDAFTSGGSAILPDGTAAVAGYFTANFQGAQWVQLQFTLNPNENSSTCSFTRLKEIRMR